jgi:hypothetical protein
MQFLRRVDCRDPSFDYEFKKPTTIRPGVWGAACCVPTKARPLRNRVQQVSHKIAPEIWIACRCYLLGSAIEIDAALVVNDKTRDGLVEIGLNAGRGSRVADDALRLRIEFEIGKREAILHSMRSEESGYTVNVAEAKDERDDGLRRDGIEAGGGRIVENDLGAADECASDGDAAAHAAGEFGGEQVEGVFEFDELQDFADALIDFRFVDAIFAETVRDVVGDGHGIEERAFLEDKADLAAEVEEIDFGHGRDFVAEDTDSALRRMQEASGEFEGECFAGSGFAKEDHGFAREDFKGEAVEDVAFVEAETHVLKGYDGVGVVGRAPGRSGDGTSGHLLDWLVADRSKRDSSTMQADAFAGSERGEKASARSGRNDKPEQWIEKIKRVCLRGRERFS